MYDHESFLKKLTIVMTDGLIVHDHEFTIIDMNAAAERIFGIRAEEIIGKKFLTDAKCPPRLSLFMSALHPSHAHAAVHRSEPDAPAQIIDVTSTVPKAELRITIVELLDSAGGAAGFARLVVDRTHELESAKSKTEFITVASHQLRTPLTAIHWSFDMLAKAPLKTAERELVRTGVLATEDLLATVDYLLDAAKIEEGKFDYHFEETDLVALLEGVLKTAGLTAQKYEVKLISRFPAMASVRVMADQRKLGVAFLNLVDNAIKYNKPNGAVTIEIESFTKQPYAKVYVKDTGIGISDADREGVFAKFFRAESVKKTRPDGTGLGLFITHNIIGGHGGTVDVVSTLGKGTTFTVTLPLYAAPA